MADARHVEFSPFCDDAQQALLDESFLFFFLQLLSAKKTHAGGYTPRGKGGGLVCAFFALCCIWATVQQKVLLFEAVSDCTSFVRRSLFFWEHTRLLLDDNDEEDNHDDDE